MGRSAALALVLLTPAWAGEADVIAAEATLAADGTWRVSATVRHADEGWQHYADAFEVLTPDGTVLATRTLHHPHVEEQPFTRSLGGVAIPKELDLIVVRARDGVHATGGATIEVPLDRSVR